MKSLTRLFHFGAITLVAVCLLRAPPARADITIGSTFAGIDARVHVADGPTDANPARDDDIQFDETWRTSYSSPASAQASKNGGAGSVTGNLNAQLSVNRNSLSYSSSAMMRCNFTSSGSFPGSSFSGASGTAVSEIVFKLTERSNYSLTGSVFVENSQTAEVALQFEFFSVENRPGDRSAHTLAISNAGVLEPGTYRLRLKVIGTSPQPLTTGTASGNLQFDIGTPQTDDIQWSNTAGGAFGTIGNWNPARVPTGMSTAIFDPAAAYTVDVGNAASSQLVVKNGDVTFNNMAYTVSSITFNPASVVLDNAKLTLASGQLNSGHALIGQSGAARVNVHPDAVWISTGSLRVGGPGNGILAISAGGTVNSTEARIGTGIGGGDVFIGGTNARWTTGSCAVGFDGAGTLTIYDGGVVDSGDSFAGRNPGSTGEVIIRDADANGHAARWDLGNHPLVVGDEGQGHVQISSGGSVVSGKLILRLHAAGTGSMSITGVSGGAVPTRSSILLTDDAIVDGSLFIASGGAFVALNTDLLIGFAFDGDVTVHGLAPDGPFQSELGGVRDLTVGTNANGKLTVNQGGQAQSKSGTLGMASGSIGRVLVEGSGNGMASKWAVAQNLVVGNSGGGVLQVKNGGAVTANFVSLGQNEDVAAFGSATVTGRASGVASQLTTGDGTFGLGLNHGILAVAAGGRVAVNGLMEIGGSDIFRGSVTVGGADPDSGFGSSILVSRDLSVGSVSSAHSELKITEDGTLTCADATLGTFADSVGTVLAGTVGGTGAPARFTMTGNLTVGDEGEGIVELHNGAIVSVGGVLSVGPLGTIAGTGTLSAAIRIRNGGYIQAGLSPGVLTFNGDFEQLPTGVLEMEIAGTTPGTTHDQLIINGDISLGGKLLLKFTGGFAPKTGDQFEFLNVAGVVSNSFTEFEVRNLAPGFQFDVVTNNQKVTMVALNDAVFVAPLPRGVQASPVTKGGITYVPYILQLDSPCRPWLPGGPPVRNGTEIVQVLSESLPGEDCSNGPAFLTNTLVLGALPPGDYNLRIVADGVTIQNVPVHVPAGTGQILTLELAASKTELNVTVNGLPEISYSIFASTDLTHWLPVFTQSGSFTHAFTKRSASQFYRIQIGVD